MTTGVRQRCAWAGGDPLMQRYHDSEWGRPIRDPRTLWESLMLEGFQASFECLVLRTLNINVPKVQPACINAVCF